MDFEEIHDHIRRVEDEAFVLRLQLAEHKSLLDATMMENDEMQRRHKSLLETITKKNDELRSERDNYKSLLEASTEKYEESQREKTNQMKELEELHQWRANKAPYCTEFTQREITEATNNFNESFKIGEGGYGSVYKAVLRHTMVAVKELNDNSCHGERQFNQEMEILSRVRHPNLVTLIGACVEARTIVYEFVPNGSLHDYLQGTDQKKCLSWEKGINIASDICSGLIFLHSNGPHGIVHGDVKPSNILITSSFGGKLGDFGICRQLKHIQDRLTAYHPTLQANGSFGYMDPDYLTSAEITIYYDVYSFGIVLLQLVTWDQDYRNIRARVETAMSKKKFDTIIRASEGNWPLAVAKKMALLGIQCSDPIRNNRPDLKVVWKEIESLKPSASRV